MSGALLANVLTRVRERGRLVSWQVDEQGWMWALMATEKQATRIKQRLDGTHVMGNAVRLACRQTCVGDWPPGMVPNGEPTVPVPQGPRPAGPRRPGGKRHRGGRRGHQVRWTQ